MWHHCGLVTLYGNINLGQHWPDNTNPSPEPPLTDIHMRAILQQVPKLLCCILSLKIQVIKLLPHLPGTIELTLEKKSLKHTTKISLLTLQLLVIY